MGQFLHGSATTTEAVRRAIQHSQESLRALSKRYGINQKTVAKWRKRTSVADVPTGLKHSTLTVLTVEEEAVIVAFRQYTLLSLVDCLYSLQPTIPTLTRSSLHRCLQRHGISRLPQVESDKPARKKFKAYPIGYFHVDIAEVQTAEGNLYLFVAIDRTSKFAYVELHREAKRRTAGDFLRHLVEAVPYKIAIVLTDNGTHFTTPGAGRSAPPDRRGSRQRRDRLGASFRIRMRTTPNPASHHQAQASLDKRTSRANEPPDQGCHRQTLPLPRSCRSRTTPH
jgi:Integrase core domain